MSRAGPSRVHSLQHVRLRDLLANPAFALAWWVYVLGSVADCVTTSIALANGLHERNPVARTIYRAAGMDALWAFKLAVLGVILYGLTWLPRRVGLVFAGALAVTILLDVNANLVELRTLLP
ncbi:MAG TPA: DUF5658 family protein [Candidatus Dormibacteraeota bacterium]|nr:DUF5658 family protein [Candidatus Dormibacteraeota bacterium]